MFSTRNISPNYSVTIDSTPPRPRHPYGAFLCDDLHRAAGTMPNSLYRMPLVYLFLACVFCYSCSFLFVVFCVFVFFFCSHWSLVDVPLIFFCPADHVPDWQPRIVLGMVEARSVNVKKTTTTTMVLHLMSKQSHVTNPRLGVICEVKILLRYRYCTPLGQRTRYMVGCIIQRKIPFAGIELTPQRVRLRGYL